MTTRGDEILDQPLATIGGKGLFLKELEVAMLEERADIAVHSFKDVPVQLEPGFAIAAMLRAPTPPMRSSATSYARLAALPRGARVGTSSLRRQAQLRALRPDLDLADLRGNVNTRLAKLDAGDYDAIVLACAGLERLGLGTRIRSRLAAPDWLPAPAPGARSRSSARDGEAGVLALLAASDDADTRSRVARRARDEPGAARQLHRADWRLVPAAANTACTCAAGRRCGQRPPAARRRQRPERPGWPRWAARWRRAVAGARRRGPCSGSDPIPHPTKTAPRRKTRRGRHRPRFGSRSAQKL